MWTTVEPFDGDDYLVSHQVRICNSRQYFDTSTGTCSLCADLTTGTIGFHETECRSCGDMWFETQDEPESMQAIVARQLCEDPAQVYADELPTGPVREQPTILDEDKPILTKAESDDVE